VDVRINISIGYLQGRDGEIKHLYRNFAFLHSRMYLDNGGIFVCKTRHLQLAGGAKVSVLVVSALHSQSFLVSSRYQQMSTVLMLASYWFQWKGNILQTLK
jgi:hypothetical protein